MNDEVIWKTATPLHTKFFIYVGVFTSYLVAALSFFLFVNSLFKLPDALSHPTLVTITFFSAYPQSYMTDAYCKGLLIISIVFCFIHLCLGYGLYKFRTYKYPLILIIGYLSAMTFSLFMKSTIVTSLTIFLLLIWFVSLMGIYSFHKVKADYIEEHTPKNTDPYNLLSTHFGQETSTTNTYYTQKYMEPIKVNLHSADTPTSKSENPPQLKEATKQEEEEEDLFKTYF